MKKTYRFISLFIASALLFAIVLLPSNAVSEEYAGSVYQCSLDSDSGMLTVSGTVDHKVATRYKDATLSLYRIQPWENTTGGIRDGALIVKIVMSMRFEFRVSCESIADRLSMYAVALEQGDEILLVAPPRYIDCNGTSAVSGRFKGVNTKDHVSAVNADASSAFVDVELDKLKSNTRNGYFYTIDGEMFYFDRAYIDNLDKAVRSYGATGANVYLRLLIPSDGELPIFTEGKSGTAPYNSIWVNNESALISLYAHIHFICSRYSGEADGSIEGFIIGRGLNEPARYNFSTDVGDGYYRMISSVVSIIGAAASDALNGKPLALILPVTDKMNADGEPNFQSFVLKVGDYLSKRTTLRVVIMAETTHNPYGLYDDYFYVEDTGEVDGDFTTVSPDITLAPESTLTPESTLAPESTLTPETTPVPTETEERPLPVPTPADAPYFCADNISIFMDALDRITAKSDAVCKEYFWCWYPDENTMDTALGVGYSYSYMSLAAAGASVFAVSFEDVGGYGISSISHLFKYIDTKASAKETSYTLAVFGAGSWSDIIFGAKESTGVYRNVLELPVSKGATNSKGSVNIWDFTAQSSNEGWYGGFNCSSLKNVTGGAGKYLKASLLSAGAGEYADIGYVGANSSLALYSDSVSFDIECPGDQNEIFEILIKLYGGQTSVEAKATVRGGERALLTIDTSGVSTDTKVDSIRLCAKRVTGEGDYELHLYKVSINSMEYTSNELSAVLDDARNDLRDNSGDTIATSRAMTAIVVVSVASISTIALVMASDKKRKNNTSEKKGN